MQTTGHSLQRPDYWSPTIRLVVFGLAGTSIWCLLVQFFGWCSMRTFTLFVSLPALGILAAMATRDRVKGTGRLWHATMVGATAGLAAAVAYDIFRLPFVYASALGVQQVIPSLPLFKVFPRFGAMLFGQPVDQPAYSVPVQLVGWAYHFSNGLTFGIMYVALLGDRARGRWFGAVAFAVGIELGMLLTPYTAFFHIPLTAQFITVTLAAHFVFGVVMGLVTLRLWAPPASIPGSS